MMEVGKRNLRRSQLLDYTNKFFEDIVKGNQTIYSIENQYTPQHPNATVQGGAPDDPMNIKGKGTGGYLDFNGGGGKYDRDAYRDVNRENKYSINKPYDPEDLSDSLG